jgi:hypothetical protein
METMTILSIAPIWLHWRGRRALSRPQANAAAPHRIAARSSPPSPQPFVGFSDHRWIGLVVFAFVFVVVFIRVIVVVWVSRW